LQVKEQENDENNISKLQKTPCNKMKWNALQENVLLGTYVWKWKIFSYVETWLSD
jgi:hypothetical protein